MGRGGGGWRKKQGQGLESQGVWDQGESSLSFKKKALILKDRPAQPIQKFGCEAGDQPEVWCRAKNCPSPIQTLLPAPVQRGDKLYLEEAG